VENNYYNILSFNENENSFESVELPFNMKFDFIKKFGTEILPDYYDLSSWVEETIVLNKIEKLNRR